MQQEDFWQFLHFKYPLFLNCRNLYANDLENILNWGEGRGGEGRGGGGEGRGGEGRGGEGRGGEGRGGEEELMSGRPCFRKPQ